MSPARTEIRVKVGNRELTLSNLDKVMYPEVGFTKGQVIDYYTRIAPVLLPHLKGRPLTLKRYPNGVDGPFFYEKNCPDHRPPWVKTQAVWSDSNDRDIDYCLAQDLPTLVWAANLADLEMHTTMALAKTPHKPTMVVFDLDPGAPADIVTCCRVGLLLKEHFDSLGLQSFPKTSGSKGLQVYVPVNTATSYDVTTPWSKKIAERLEKDAPGSRRVEAEEGAAGRQGARRLEPERRLEDDSVRLLAARAIASHLLDARDVGRGRRSAAGDLRLVFETEDVLARVEEHGDLYAPVLTLKQKLPS